MQLQGQLVIASQLAGAQQQPRQSLQCTRGGRPCPAALGQGLAGAAGLACAAANFQQPPLLTHAQRLLSRHGR